MKQQEHENTPDDGQDEIADSIEKLQRALQPKPRQQMVHFDASTYEYCNAAFEQQKGEPGGYRDKKTFFGALFSQTDATIAGLMSDCDRAAHELGAATQELEELRRRPAAAPPENSAVWWKVGLAIAAILAIIAAAIAWRKSRQLNDYMQQ